MSKKQSTHTAVNSVSAYRPQDEAIGCLREGHAVVVIDPRFPDILPSAHFTHMEGGMLGIINELLNLALTLLLDVLW